MEIILWSSFVTILYCFFGYPLLLKVFASLCPNPVSKKFNTPKVSVVIAVWNEEGMIGAKISGLLRQDYPKDQLEILIGSDGSTDRTNDIVRSFNDPRVILIDCPERRGKSAVLNDLIARATGEVIVFNDVRQELNVAAVKELVANFADPKVGCVSGELVFREKTGATARGIDLYWKYEKFMRDCEAKIHSMLGATGAIYAIRKSLFRSVPKEIVLDDMYIPFKVIEQGYRAIFDNSAQAFDDVADTPGEEHRRKARTLYGNYQMFAAFPHMFNPFKSPIAIQFFSHKFLRVVVPFLMIIILICNLFLLAEPTYKVLLLAQLSFYGAALVGGLLRDKKYGILRPVLKVCYIPYVFCLLNFSALIGFYRFVCSKQQSTWDKARR